MLCGFRKHRQQFSSFELHRQLPQQRYEADVVTEPGTAYIKQRTSDDERKEETSTARKQ